MNPAFGRALVLGAANPLGTAVVRRLVLEKDVEIIMADLPQNLGFMQAFALEFSHCASQVSVAPFDPTRSLLGLDGPVIERFSNEPCAIFLLGLLRDRTLKAAQIRNHNMALLEGAIDISRMAKKLKSLVVATDVGLIGDYPGRFYENWLDAGQTPFDAVDSSSFEIETACLREKSLPIVRARIGLLSDLIEPAGKKRYWKSAAQILLPSLGFLRFLPGFLAIPTAVAKGCLAPITPTEGAAQAVIALSHNPDAAGKAVHLVLDEAPSMNSVLEGIGRLAGGATVKGGGHTRVVDVLGAIPGMRETARRGSDRVASWWAPHRYCLSRNELDTKQKGVLIKSAWRNVDTGDSIQTYFRLI